MHPKYPDGGKMSQYLESLSIGDTIDVRGPNGLIEYIAPGQFSVRLDKKALPHTKSAKRVSISTRTVISLNLKAHYNI